MTSVLGTVSGLVRLPLRLVGVALGVARSVVPGARREERPASTSRASRPSPSSSTSSPFSAGPVAEPDAGPRTPQGDPLRGPTTTPSTAADDTEDTGDTDVATDGADPGERLASVTDIDADAGPDDVDVTPSDVADAMGSQLDDRPPSPS
ncbi:hypothetical protein GCM10023340_24110 [Nocardioides marinquilinus]|uniref:Uncharacterized protein n=1 Tax=Nocardioides marinquilinus TaxID=1210400 RepID=A0ABP9PUB2_9ACTN